MAKFTAHIEIEEHGGANALDFYADTLADLERQIGTRIAMSYFHKPVKEPIIRVWKYKDGKRIF